MSAGLLFVREEIDNPTEERRSNLAKHGIDRADLEGAFDFPMVTDEDDCLPLWGAATP
jgi:hypothetical protein